MPDDGVGYGKPPRGSRFKTGVSGNPRGRPKRRPAPVAETIGAFLDAPIEYREGGRIKTVSRKEFTLRMLVDRAVEGDVKAAENVLLARLQARRRDGSGAREIEVANWLPDYPGQTRKRKTDVQDSDDAAKATPCIATERSGDER